MIFLLQILATYAIVFTLVYKDGPYGIIYKVRHLKGLGAMKCVTCLSWWIAPIMALYGAVNVIEWVITACALVATTIFIDQASQKLI